MGQYLNLQEDITEIRKHQRKGFERIRLWYTVDDEDPREVTGLNLPPHEILRREATKFIVEALDARDRGYDDSGELWSVDRFAWYVNYYAFLGIGSEILLNAIALKHDPEFYLDEMGDNRSPHIDTLREKVLDLMEDDTTKEQRQRVDRIFELLKTHRNNLVHLSFHHHMHNNHPPRILEVLAFLLVYFFEDDLAVIDQLNKEIKKFDRESAGLEYPPVDFPIN